MVFDWFGWFCWDWFIVLLVICLMFGFYLSVWVVDFGSVNSVVVVVIFVLLCLIVLLFQSWYFWCLCLLFV